MSLGAVALVLLVLVLLKVLKVWTAVCVFVVLAAVLWIFTRR